MGMMGLLKKAAGGVLKDTSKTVKIITGTSTIMDGARYIVETGTYIFSLKRAIANAHAETFEDAVTRLRVTDEDLKKNYNNFVLTFYISAIFALVCIVLAANYFLNKHSIMSGLSSISIMAICLANCFKYSLRAFQIKHRTLCSVKAFTSRVNEWFPRFA